MDRIRPDYVCALILTRSRLGLLPVIFRILPLIDVRFLFPLNLENKWIRLLPNCVYAFILTISKLGFKNETCHFSKTCHRVIAFD